MKETIKKIVEGYKGVKVKSVFASNKKDYVGIIATNSPKERTMRLVSVKIFNNFPSIEFINWEGGWVNYAYTRRTLSLLGYNLKKVAKKLK